MNMDLNDEIDLNGFQIKQLGPEHDPEKKDAPGQMAGDGQDERQQAEAELQLAALPEYEQKRLRRAHLSDDEVLAAMKRKQQEIMDGSKLGTAAADGDILGAPGGDYAVLVAAIASSVEAGGTKKRATEDGLDFSKTQSGESGSEQDAEEDVVDLFRNNKNNPKKPRPRVVDFDPHDSSSDGDKDSQSSVAQLRNTVAQHLDQQTLREELHLVRKSTPLSICLMFIFPYCFIQSCSC